ncbi:radical SAM/SPASM domain-containing protein [Streptomyces ipomoeae]|uniref:radical SAM/SPASM domain-containing protein n=1 Tax=Streptomyces ipomoeae TaxID=103232 RepID=UPI00114676E5|nr:radical SAM protein [Streptomyces ipomoeae]MDX2935981.1 radical SAM protein [Streptomyces ipomoeae]TQE14758.1 radical SAM protein [Streptomyces ipomoeae]
MTIAPEAPTTPTPLTFLELEITGRCQLTCSSHCYAEAGPTKDHGTMTGEDWRRVIDEAAAIGVETVQFIGGEPTLQPEFTALVRYALEAGVRVQVFSNLYQVRAEHWELYEHPRVTLGTSYYSDDPAEHDAITGRKGSHDSTRANIIEAVRRGIRVKVGIIHMRDGQRSEEARAEMAGLGVARVHIDQVRGVGNAAKTMIPSTSSLCGRCADGKAAILPDGKVTPCVLGRFLPSGDVKAGSLAQVFAGEEWARVAASIPRRHRGGCAPDTCTPNEDSCMPSPGVTQGVMRGCNPDNDSDDCAPAETDACEPAYD